MYVFAVVAWDPEDLSGVSDRWITYLGESSTWEDPTGDVVTCITNGTPATSNTSLSFDQADEACVWAASVWDAVGICAMWVPREVSDGSLICHTWEEIPNQYDGAPWRAFRRFWHQLDPSPGGGHGGAL